MKLLLLLILLLSVACAKQKPSKAVEVYAFGDYLTQGDSYAHRIAEHLDKRIWNQAVDESTLYGVGQYRSVYNTTFNEGSIIIFLSGTTDAVEFSDEPDYVGRYISTMRELLNKFEASKAHAYIGGCIKQASFTAEESVLCDSLAAELKTLIEEYSYSHYVPTHENISGHRQVLIEQEFGRML